VDAVTELGSENVVDQAVLGEAAEAGERRRLDRRVEMVSVAADLGAGSGDPRLDPLLQLVWVNRHEEKRSDRGAAAILGEAMITLTDKGAEKVQEFLAAQAAVAGTAGLRVGVRGGGCSGFQYALAFDEQRDGDTVFEDRGIRLLVDGPSLPYVKGSVIDFVDELQGAGFKVENPNVIAACGCGSSFRVADEEEVSAV
jgi:iron-sulfur cluster assembly protein